MSSRSGPTYLGGAPFALARRVVDALTAHTRPHRLVLLVDGAHLLDELWALVVHQVVQAKMATVVMTIRAREQAPAAVTALSKDGVVHRREVQPLTRDHTVDLQSTTFGSIPDQQCRDELWRLTRGNVLFLRQLVEQESRAGRMFSEGGVLRWAGNAPISGSLAELVDAQIGATPEDVCDVVDLVAVSEPVDWNCRRPIADQDAIERAEQLELIRISGDDVFIGHPMYAEVR